jgi:exportin-2 (importin alpha re-exporter)
MIQEDPGTQALSVTDRTSIKAGILRLMLNVPPLVQRQISQALGHISKFDYPYDWPTLLPEISSELRSAKDATVVVGLLDTVQAVFERFRTADETSEEARMVLKISVEGFSAPLSEIMKALDSQLEQAGREGKPLAIQLPLTKALNCVCSIFYLLNKLDLPEYFEDHLNEWMQLFHKYLIANNPVIMAPPGDVEEGPLEALQSQVLECVELYAQKYDEEFEPFFLTFIQDVWGLIAGGKISEEKLMSTNMDNLVTRAVKFLASVAPKPQHAGVFSQEASLRELFARVVVPNMRLRAFDLECFTDNPEDFIRSDIEGNNTDTRRRVVTDLVRALSKSYNAQVTPMCVDLIGRSLTEYEESKDSRAAMKDAAIALMCAIAAKSASETHGVTSVNELVSLGDFLSRHILPELQLPIQANLDDRPIAKAAAIKFIATFRGLFNQEQLHGLLPLLVPFMQAKSFVVHTYAAEAIERILNVKNPSAPNLQGVMMPRTPRVSVDAIQPMVPAIFTNVFSHIVREDYPENEHLMRCVLRVVVVSRERIGSLTPQVIQSLTTILLRVCKNPSNPTYNHYLFETVACLMRSICSANPEHVKVFETMLMPPFQTVLSQDVAEFLPYVFQLMGLLIELKSKHSSIPSASASPTVLSEGEKALFPPLLTPILWNKRGNVPALTDLLVAYLRKGATFILEAGHLPSLLGLWQRLMSVKNQDQFAFQILNAIFLNVPLQILQQFMVPILTGALTHVHASKAIRVARMFVHSASLFSGRHGPAALEAAMESLGSGTFLGVLDGVFAATGNRITGENNRKEAAVGITRILCEYDMMSDPSRHSLWSKLLNVTIELLSPAGAHDAPIGVKQRAQMRAAAARGATHQAEGDMHSKPFVEEEDEDDIGHEDSVEALPLEYSAAYARLVHATVRPSFAFTAEAPDVPAFIGSSISSLSRRVQTGLVSTLVSQTPVASTVNQLVNSRGGYAARL